MVMAKVCYILHGLGANPSDNWFLWLRSELIVKGYQVLVPELPNSNLPQLPAWLEALNKLVAQYGKGVIVGHSLGGVLAMQYILTGGRASEVILVATPFNKLESIPEIANFMADWPAMVKLASQRLKDIQFVVLQSNDDFHVPESHGRAWAKLLNAKYQLLPYHGHFNEVDLPEILEHF